MRISNCDISLTTRVWNYVRYSHILLIAALNIGNKIIFRHETAVIDFKSNFNRSFVIITECCPMWCRFRKDIRDYFSIWHSAEFKKKKIKNTSPKPTVAQNHSKGINLYRTPCVARNLTFEYIRENESIFDTTFVDERHFGHFTKLCIIIWSHVTNSIFICYRPNLA
jgi:hypothetical protein